MTQLQYTQLLLEAIEAQFKKAYASAQTLEQLNEIHTTIMGRNGIMNELFKSLWSPK